MSGQRGVCWPAPLWVADAGYASNHELPTTQALGGHAPTSIVRPDLSADAQGVPDVKLMRALGQLLFAMASIEKSP
jgi:hypothetical protein